MEADVALNSEFATLIILLASWMAALNWEISALKTVVELVLLLLFGIVSVHLQNEKERRGELPYPSGFTDNLEPIVAGWSSNNLVLVGLIVWLLFDVIGQPGKQFEYLSGLHFSKFYRIDGGEEVAELNSERKHSLIEC